MSSDYPLQCLETTIQEVKTGRESKNGTPYAALVTPSGAWVFVWEGPWKQEVEHNVDDYRGLDAEIYVRDKSDDPDDTFYNLEAVVPQSTEKAREFFERNRLQESFKNERGEKSK